MGGMGSWSEGTCRNGDVRIRYVRTGGGGPPVVLLHGLMGSGACWSPLAEALEGEFDVVMPDARGHGGSSAPESGYLYDDLAGDVLDMVRDLDLSRPVLVGHSMGGMTAAVAAQCSGGNLRGLVLIDPTFISPELQREVWASDVAEQHRRALGLTTSELVADALARHPHRRADIIERQAEARLHTSPSAFEVLKPPNPEFRAVAGAIEVPTVIVIGDSGVVSLELAVELSQHNPRITVEQIPNAGHGLPFDQPEQLERVVLSFLRGLSDNR
ncbi:MAG: hydrolase (pyridoxal phosphatase) Cof [Ilumatobacteraceae bacterium]|nr:hydrolase (pyridoxal phosphatase) Cof [Ilumatobacteraceae bacterium]